MYCVCSYDEESCFARGPHLPEQSGKGNLQELRLSQFSPDFQVSHNSNFRP